MSKSNLYIVEIDNAAYKDDFSDSAIFIEKKTVEIRLWVKSEFL